MYIAGRFRTASRPSRTLILSAEYSATSAAVPWPLLLGTVLPVCSAGRLSRFALFSSFLICASIQVCTTLVCVDAGRRAMTVASSVRTYRSGNCSHAHRHDDVGVFVALGADRRHHGLADFVFQLERDRIASSPRQESRAHTAR